MRRETSSNGTDSADNSQLREEEAKGAFKGVKSKGRQDLDQRSPGGIQKRRCRHAKQRDLSWVQ